MSETLIRQVEDRQYLGLARVLRGRIAVAAAKTTARIGVIVRTEKTNFKRRNKGPRPESLLAIERAWRDLLTFGLLDQDITCTKKALVIVEHRMVANRLVRLPGVSASWMSQELLSSRASCRCSLVRSSGLQPLRQRSVYTAWHVDTTMMRRTSPT
jgi:hypothetical protein